MTDKEEIGGIGCCDWKSPTQRLAELQNRTDIEKLKALLDEFGVGYSHNPSKTLKVDGKYLIYPETIETQNGNSKNIGDDDTCIQFIFRAATGQFLEMGAFVG